MEGVVSDESRKRRLPLWMLGVSAADKVQKSENEGVNGVTNTENEGTAKSSRLSKSRARRTAQAQQKKEVSGPCKDDLDGEQSSLVIKRGTVIRKRKASKKDVKDDSADVEETVIEKSKRSLGGRAVQKSARGRRVKVDSIGSESNEDIEDASPNEDDEDLTMEDLMSIAKECVEVNKDAELQQKSDGEQRAESQCAAITLSTDKLTGSLGAPETDRRSPTHKDTAPSHNRTDSSTTKEILVNPSRTGDPTQDMLNLFLGPLLKKPLEDEKKKKAELITNDMISAHEFRKQSQEVVTSDVPVPVTKKKSSLKDKVAMFLD